MLRKLFTLIVGLVAAIATASAQTPPDNEIWYTTTDGKTISFNDDDLVSHNYNNGRGVLKFEDRVTSIGYRAFYYCSSLTSITIPNSVTSIGEYAFAGCSSLTSITIPNSVTSIGYQAFAGCSSLTSITIPNSVTSIGEVAFYGCSSLKSVKGKYASSDGRCLIIDGKLIAYAPAGLTSYTIPNSVTSIEYGAFAGCSSLTSITIPNSVTSIGYQAFAGCSSLKSFKGKYASSDGRCLIIDGKLIAYAPAGLTSYTIPNSVTSIERYVFSHCSSLKSITIPNSVTSIEYGAFAGCSSLTSITIGNSVTSIGKWAFEDCSSLTSITIGNSVTSIEYEAFSGCSSLKSVKVSNKYCYDYFKLGVSDITFIVSTPKEYEETQKIGATKLAIDSNSKYASEDGLCLIDNGKLILFIGKDLTEYTIPESVTSFGEEVFKDCSNLKSVKVANKDCYDYFKDKVDDIAFHGANASADGRCLIVNGELQRFIGKGVTQYSIPESVTSFGEGAFNGCSRLKSVKVANEYCYDYFKDKVADIAFYGANASANGRCLIVNGELQRFIGKGVTQFSIPDSVAEIGRGAFSGCSSLTSITIPNSVTEIGRGAFSGCSSLTSITIPNSVTEIGRGAFNRCSSLTSITIPDSVTWIGWGAFSGCSSLTSITIPDSVTSIEYGAFAGCSSLTSITIPNSVTKIGESAFKGCSSLTSITIPNSVTSIGDYAFKGCSSLKSITIPNSVTSIEDEAFDDCSSLTSITCFATTPPAISDLSIAETTMIYVPKEAVKAYKQDPEWSIYKKQIKRIK